MASVTPERIESIISQEPGIRLLKATSAPIVISFLYNTFRKNNVPEITYEEFKIKLEEFLSEHVMDEYSIEEELEDQEQKEIFDTIDLSNRVKYYAEDWFSEKKRYISRYYNQNKVEMIRPDASVMRLFSFLDSILDSDYIGTESTFNYILTQLRTLNENMNKDPETRIRELKSKIKEIESEIKYIEESGTVKTYDSRKIVEYLNDVRRRSREMVGEFSQLEENFRDIMIEISKKQSEEALSKRKILSLSLDMHDKLYASPQGQSFNGFWNYISIDRDDEVSSLSEGILNQLEEDEIKYDASFLKSLRKTLFEAGSRIINKNDILTERMSKMISLSDRPDRRGMEKLFSSIKAESAGILQNNCDTTFFEMSVEDTKPSFSFPLSRTLSTLSEERINKSISFEEKNSNIASIFALKNEFHVDEKELRTKLLSYFRETGSSVFTLKEFFARFPVEKGLEEVVAYLSVIKENYKKSIIQEDEMEEISYMWNEKKYLLTLPKVTVVI